jgi:ribosomal protein L11 methyltransferase
MSTPVRTRLWQVSLTATRETEDACIEALSQALGVPASGYTDFETGAVRVAVYLETRPADYRQRLNSVADFLAAVGTGAPRMRPADIKCRWMRRENWAESWKKHFKPLSIGRALLLKPSWIRKRPKQGQSVLVLDPGLSFGTGHHATTGFCLREVVRFHHRGGGSMLDIGCGSGVLAIAAARLGCRPVEAFDLDPEAVRVARGNARRNGLGGRMRFREADVSKLPQRPARRFNLVCANLMADLLLAARRRIASRVDAGGTLVLAGILESEFPEVVRAYEKLGLRLVRQKAEREWCSGAFAWTPSRTHLRSA